MSVHVEVLSPKERAFCAYDYESLILLNILMLERWFYPLVPENSDPSRYFSANPRNLYLEENGDEISIKANTWILNNNCSTVCLGVKTDIAYDAFIRNSCIGAHTEISSKTRITSSMIGKNCKIGENCVIEYAFIGDDVVIPNGAHIPKESIIGNGVMYPKELPNIQNTAIFKNAINEETFEKLSSQPIGNVHVSKFRNGGPFWRRSVNGKTNFALEEDDSESEYSESEEEDDGVGNSTKMFHDEVLESMQKILESENSLMRNLILEINSSKLACNVTMDEVARNVFAAFMKLKHNQDFNKMKELIVKWQPLFLNYYKTSAESLKVKSADQKRFELDLKRRCQIQLLLAIEDKFDRDESFGVKAQALVHYLYQEADILDEDSIIEWAGSIAEESKLKGLMKKIVDWLQEDDDEEESEDE